MLLGCDREGGEESCPQEACFISAPFLCPPQAEIQTTYVTTEPSASGNSRAVTVLLSLGAMSQVKREGLSGDSHMLSF